MATDHARPDLIGDVLAGEVPARLETALWVVAVALFGVGDLVTTTVLIHVGGAEAHPLLRYAFMYLPATVGLAFAVGAQLVVAYIVYARLEHPARVLIPLWLALYGAVVVAWNWAYVASL